MENKFILEEPVFHERFGIGKIVVINPYKNGTPLYEKNNHYKVKFSKLNLTITVFEDSLNGI